MFGLLLTAWLQPPDGTVELDGGRAMEFLAPEAPARPPGPWMAKRDCDANVIEAGVEISCEWTVRAQDPGWLWATLAGPGAQIRSATWNGRETILHATEEGVVVLEEMGAKTSARLRAKIFVEGDLQREVGFSLAPAVAGRFRVGASKTPQLVADLRADGEPLIPVRDAYWTGARGLRLTMAPVPTPTGDAAIAVARSAIGLTVGENETAGRARLIWDVRKGELTEVGFSASHLGADLRITGANLQAIRTEGDRRVIELQRPAKDRVTIDLEWSTGAVSGAEGRLVIPSIKPEAWRSSAILQLARDGDVELVPEIAEARAIASASVPDWGSGLIAGTPTAAFEHTAPIGGGIDVLRLVHIAGPPVVVDVAAYTLALTREGRSIIRALYEVRNEHAAVLRVRAPEGMNIIGAQVAGETVAPAREKDGTWRVPLQRSVESVEGLLSFPVEITFLGTDEGEWERREKRQFELPTVHAPIAVARATMHLPPGYKSTLDTGTHGIVERFSEGEGITYGLGVGDVGIAKADAYFRSAVQGWLDNDFEKAQRDLDVLKELGADNANVARLQRNLDVVNAGPARPSKEERGSETIALERRVKDLAKARSTGDVRKQEKLEKQAEEHRSAGRYEEAERDYAQVIEIGDKLAALEQEEAVDQKTKNTRYRASLIAVREVREGQKKKNKPKDAAAKDGDDRFEGKGGKGQKTTRSDDAENESVGNRAGTEISRDFTAVVEAAPSIPALADSTKMPEPPKPMMAPAPEMVEASQKSSLRHSRVAMRGRIGRGSFGRSGKSAPESKRTGTLTGPMAPAAPPAPPSENLPMGGVGILGGEIVPTQAPLEVTASAMSVVIPAAGEAVHYQRLLLQPGIAQVLHIAARERLFDKRTKTK